MALPSRQTGRAHHWVQTWHRRLAGRGVSEEIIVSTGVRGFVGDQAQTVIYDITPPITPQLAVWPGDTPMSREILCDIHKGANITLSTLRGTVHLGAHADGPNHYGKDAPAIDERSLEYYIGR